MKINNEYIVGDIKEIRPQIFALAIKDNYQRTMLFCRYIELWESPYDEIRNKFFTWEKFMEVYRKENKQDLFTYPEDWDGFGISSDMIQTGISVFNRDKGPYDQIMSEIYSYCQNKFSTPNKRWYLIGTDNYSSTTIDHEIAHGLYEVNDEYRRNCDELIHKIDSNDYETLRKKIVDMGYMDDRETIDDEIQAWMSTGLSNGLNTEKLKTYRKEFTDNFKNFDKLEKQEMSLSNLLPSGLK